MHLCALNSKSEPESELVAEFSRVFSATAPEVLQWAFREHRERSAYFPTISELRGLACEYRVKERQKREVEEVEAERRRIAEAREHGELVDFTDIKKELLSIAAFPAEPNEHQRRQQAAINRLRRVEMPPALQLTPAQIEARRDKEREEINREVERSSATCTVTWSVTGATRSSCSGQRQPSVIRSNGKSRA
jgi:hypothetical protein